MTFPNLGAHFRLNTRFLPITVTLGLFLAMFGAGALLFDNFIGLQNFLYLLINNAPLGITAIGMTFVIVSGGIDLSVGSVIALVGMVSAALLEQHGWSPAAVIPLSLAIGAAIGLLHGFLIQYFDVQPFIATLAGQFLARGLCYVVSIGRIDIRDDTYATLSNHHFELPFGDPPAWINFNVVLLLLVFAAGIYLAHYTRFGRTVYAVGGSEPSAMLMGLPVASTKVLVYVLSGFCAALAGVAWSVSSLSGWGLTAKGLEMDAITAVVVGGTLLTGGLGYVAGTFLGMLVVATILVLIDFQGDISTWWVKIVMGILLLIFCLFQKVFERKQSTRTVSGPHAPARAADRASKAVG